MVNFYNLSIPSSTDHDSRTCTQSISSSTCASLTHRTRHSNIQSPGEAEEAAKQSSDDENSASPRAPNARHPRHSTVLSSDEDETAELSPARNDHTWPLRARRHIRHSLIVSSDDDDDEQKIQNEKSADQLDNCEDSHAADPEDLETSCDIDMFSSGEKCFRGAMKLDDTPVEGFKAGIALLPHQVVGRSWMKEQELKRMGGILADDMGLGKTIQALTRITEGRLSESDREAGWDACTLVVCPLGLVHQWLDEINKLTDGVVMVKHHGSSRTSDPAHLKFADIVVTTYDVLKSEYDAWNPTSKPKKTRKHSDNDRGTSKARKDVLFKVAWYRVVLDEAHNIKNPDTQAAQACWALNAKFRWALTGTPMQNNVTELFSLLKFLRIEPLSIWEKFNEQIAKPLKSDMGNKTATRKLQDYLKEVMLRRRKDDTLDGQPLIQLPLRMVNVISCTFSPSERRFYDRLEAKMNSRVGQLVHAAQEPGGKANYMSSVLLLLLRLRQACNHPGMISNDYKDDSDVDHELKTRKDISGERKLAASFDHLGVASKCKICVAPLTTTNIGNIEGYCEECAGIATQAKQDNKSQPNSAKIRKACEILKDINRRSLGSEKTIVFSQFTTMLDILQPFLTENNFQYVRYDGSMSPTQREASLHAIENDPAMKVILISFKAGSTGLNLTACNNVILLDLWWNPASEDQAFDRVHRLGQKRDVNIYKLKIDGTVEDRILELQTAKRALAITALSGGEVKDRQMGKDELLALFRDH